MQLIEKPPLAGLNDKNIHNLTRQESMAGAVSRHGMVRAQVPFSETLWFSPTLCGLGTQAALLPASAQMSHSYFVEVYSVHLIRSHISSFQKFHCLSSGFHDKNTVDLMD